MSETATLTPKAAKLAKYGKPHPKVPPFARYVGTSAWRSNKKRVKAYALYQASLNAA